MNLEYNSQFGQDKWIVENLFGGMTHGFFVDIGAGDGHIISNTLVLEKYLKWDGICIDPCDVTWDTLQKRNCKVDNVLVSDFDGNQDFYEVTSKGYYDSYFSSTKKPDSHYSEFEIKNKKCERLYTILNRLNSDTLIHYLSIDTEGMEYAILKRFFEDEYITDKETWKRRIISLSIEHNLNENYRKKINDLMTQYHYTLATTLGVDDIYVHKIYDVMYK